MQKWKVFEDRWHPVKDDEGGHYLVSEVDEQIATLKANAEFLSSELERLRSRVVLTPAESHLTMPAALEEGEEG